MSDFVNNFWSIYVTAITLGGIIGCLLLLYLTARKKVVPSADNTTGHVWDEDLRELNNPMPKWWMWLFIITSVFGFSYLAAYPGLGSFAGKLGWTQLGAYENEMAKARADLEPLYAKFTSMSTEDMARTPGHGHRRAPVHEQLRAVPRLGCTRRQELPQPDRWRLAAWRHARQDQGNHHGGPHRHHAAHGRCRRHARRCAQPLALCAEPVGQPARLAQGFAGQVKFTACAACHGMDGKGNQALGAPNLTDDIWLHGWGEAAITAMINNGKHNEMPAQKDKLTEAQIAVLASYVWGMSHKDGAVRQ